VREGSRRVYTGRVISLDIDTVRFPDGSTGELEMIRHPGASAVVPFLNDPRDPDPEILLLKQYRHAAGDYLYEIPAGRLAPGEDPESCAARELREETGCDAAHLEHLVTVYTTPGFTDERIHLFLATGLLEGDTAHEPDEFITMESHALSVALEMIRRGTIRDCKTAVAILYTARFRANR
jgi:ADP-ribose pyrophosphatase